MSVLKAQELSVLQQGSRAEGPTVASFLPARAQGRAQTSDSGAPVLLPSSQVGLGNIQP